MTAKLQRSLSDWNLEKNNYCNIVKLVIPKKDKTLEPDVFTEPKKIRQKMTEHFEEIFKSQNANKDKDKIKDFLTSDDDPTPYEELLKRQIPEELKEELEGFLTKLELEEALFKDMKPNSAPGIDGFTVKFFRTFWPSLAPLITNDNIGTCLLNLMSTMMHCNKTELMVYSY